MPNKIKLFCFLIVFAAGLTFSANHAAAAYTHPAGSLVISQGTVYRVSEDSKSLEGFDTPEKYFSYRYNFSQAAPATPDDLALSKTVIPWGDGRLFLDQGVGYQVSSGEKHGFVSQEAFIGQGFKFSQAQVGSLNLVSGKNIESADEAHLVGTFVIDSGGTVWRMSETEREGVASTQHLHSWGLGFDEVVPANANDMTKPAGGLLPFRSGSLVNDLGAIWIIENNNKKAFPSAACLTNFGYSLQNVLTGSTQGYENAGSICGPAPAVAYERKVVATSRGNFTADVLEVNMESGIKVVTDTANETDCLTNCPVRTLQEFANENNGFAGINGSYFCPTSYPECAGKTNSFYWKVYNSQAGRMINANNSIKEDKPFVAFNAKNAVRFFNQYSDLKNSGFEAVAGISNEPIVVRNGQIVAAENTTDEKELTVKSTRGGLGVKGQTVYAVIVRSATVLDLAAVMQTLGADNAFNLDGGGSSALYYEGGYKVGPGRALPNALIFVK